MPSDVRAPHIPELPPTFHLERISHVLKSMYEVDLRTALMGLSNLSDLPSFGVGFGNVPKYHFLEQPREKDITDLLRRMSGPFEFVIKVVARLPDAPRDDASRADGLAQEATQERLRKVRFRAVVSYPYPFGKLADDAAGDCEIEFNARSVDFLSEPSSKMPVFRPPQILGGRD
jgi:hypothetical protein